jgi:hypothetical protein
MVCPTIFNGAKVRIELMLENIITARKGILAWIKSPGLST